MTGARAARPPLPPEADLRGAIRDALESPRGAAPLRTLVHRGDRVLVALDDPLACAARDGSRSRALALEAVLEVLDSCGVERSTVTLVSASGLRPRASRAAAVSLYGDAAAAFPVHRLVSHDALDERAIVSLGETVHGIETELRHDAFLADLVIHAGAVSAPGEGGMAPFACGLASWRSVRHLHAPFGPAQRIAPEELLREQGRTLESARRREGRGGFFSLVVALDFVSGEAVSAFAGAPLAAQEAALDALRAPLLPAGAIEGQEGVLRELALASLVLAEGGTLAIDRAAPTKDELVRSFEEAEERVEQVGPREAYRLAHGVHPAAGFIEKAALARAASRFRLVREDPGAPVLDL